MINWLTAFVRAFRFIQKYRDRQASLRRELQAEARQRHEDNLESYTVIIRELSSLIQKQLAPISELVDIQHKQVDLLTTWFKSFQPSTDPTPKASHEEDPWIPAVPGGRAAFFPDADLPEEFKLAFMLQHDTEGTFDREGRDEM